MTVSHSTILSDVGSDCGFDTFAQRTAHRHDLGEPEADLTHQLTRYWQELPRTSADLRRGRLEAARAAVRSGELGASALVPFALGDVDEDVVASAATAYVAAGPTSIERRLAAVNDVVEWIRRDLALNRGALFAALLSFGDVAIEDRLRGLRLTLGEADMARVMGRCSASPHASVRDFLADWHELLRVKDQ